MAIDCSGDLLFNSGYGSAVKAYGCRAWVNFDGYSGSIGSGRANGNVSSVTDHGTGDYQVNFTTGFGNDNYAFTFGSGGMQNTTGSCLAQVRMGGTSQFVGANAIRFSLSGGSYGDDSYVCVAVFR